MKDMSTNLIYLYFFSPSPDQKFNKDRENKKISKDCFFKNQNIIK